MHQHDSFDSHESPSFIAYPEHRLQNKHGYACTQTIIEYCFGLFNQPQTFLREFEK